MEQVSDKLLNWASDIDPEALIQAARTSRLPFIAGHVALMPDAHVGMGSTVGSVIPTIGAIIPSAVGVDIGCGMIAVQTDLKDSDLPDNIDGMVDSISQVIPAGVGKGHYASSNQANNWLEENQHRFSTQLDSNLVKTCLQQFGTLGSGNHFVEICLDESNEVWVVLHSGSRGLGNKLAQKHITKAKKICKQLFIPLEDPDLAYFVQSQPEFSDYIYDMLTCQNWALANREQMMDAVLRVLLFTVGKGSELKRINCHHNFTQLEHHHNKEVWITRKGAIKAYRGDLGIIPGSMGTRSYIVRGLGNPASYNSCSHGAGRRLSRSKAKQTYTIEDLQKEMSEVKGWQKSQAQYLIDEIPSSYKDIDQVMNDQKDLVEIIHTLRQVLNYKGTK